jgi:hypothetical protein
MAEDHLGDPNIVLWVLGHIDAVAVILQNDDAVFADGDVDVGDSPLVGGFLGRRGGTVLLHHPDDVVAAIHNTLVE